MKILVVGGSGTVGQAVVELLAKKHEVVVAGREAKDVSVDMTSIDSIQAMYQTVGNLDAVIATTGKAQFGMLSDLTAEDFMLGLQNKLMGQVNLVLEGMKYVNERASFTLTSGILNREFIPSAVPAAMANGAIDAFVQAAATEMPRSMRINCVSPTMLTESQNVYGDYFQGFAPVRAATVAEAYLKSVANLHTGRVYTVG